MGLRERLLSGTIGVEVLGSDEQVLRLKWNGKVLKFPFDYVLLECDVCGRVESLANMVEQRGEELEMPKQITVSVKEDHGYDLDGNVCVLKEKMVCSDDCSNAGGYY